MRTYAEYLTSLTVKTLNAIAKQMGLKGYSKLRKAALVAFIDDAIVNDCVDISADALHFAQFGVWPCEVKILDVTNEADMDAIAALMVGVEQILDEAFPPSVEEIDNAYRASLPVFSSAPESPAEAMTPATPTETTVDDDAPSLDELKTAYRNMRATYRKAVGVTQVKLGQRLRRMGAQIRAYGVNPQYV